MNYPPVPLPSTLAPFLSDKYNLPPKTFEFLTNGTYLYHSNEDQFETFKYDNFVLGATRLPSGIVAEWNKKYGWIALVCFGYVDDLREVEALHRQKLRFSGAREWRRLELDVEITRTSGVAGEKEGKGVLLIELHVHQWSDETVRKKRGLGAPPNLW